MNLRRQGGAYERAAEAFLVAAGARVLERNYRRAGGEVDLIVRMGDATVFVEVKQRSDGRHGTPGEAVNAAKQARISRVALAYLKENHLLDGRVRFDVVEIGPDGIRHIRSAFNYRETRAR